MTAAPERPLAWVTGSAGLIGSALVETAATYGPQWRIRPLTRADADLTNSASVTELFRAERPGLVIHCAAVSKSPACEAQPALARRINVEATGLLANLCEEIPFVFLSTDLIFDGLKGLYVEDDPPNPINIYAETKVAAEALINRNPAHLIVRTSVNASHLPTSPRGFNGELKAAWRDGRDTPLFVDEFRSPIVVTVTSRAIWELINQRAQGVYHIAGAERLSRWEMGEIIAHCNPAIAANYKRAFLRDYQGPRRSPDTSLCSAKAQAHLSFTLPGLREWVRAGGLL